MYCCVIMILVILLLIVGRHRRGRRMQMDLELEAHRAAALDSSISRRSTRNSMTAVRIESHYQPVDNNRLVQLSSRSSFGQGGSGSAGSLPGSVPGSREMILQQQMGGGTYVDAPGMSSGSLGSFESLGGASNMSLGGRPSTEVVGYSTLPVAKTASEYAR